MRRYHLTFGFVLAGAAAFAILTTTTAWAQAAQPAKPTAPAVAAQPAQPQPPAPPARPGARRAQLAGNGLNLTEDQKSRITALRDTQQKDMLASREAARAARQKLAELQRAETFDEKAFRAAANAVATAEADTMVARARHRAQYLGLLTPEQRTRVQQRQAFAQREGRMLAQREMRGFRNGYREGVMRGLRQQRPGRMGPDMIGPGMMMSPDLGQGWRRGGRMGRDWAPVPPVPPVPPAPPAPPVKK